MTTAEAIAQLPDSAVCYLPGVGEVTVGEIRESWGPDCDEDERTIKMWGYIATHPNAKPWLWPRNSGRIPADNAGSTG